MNRTQKLTEKTMDLVFDEHQKRTSRGVPAKLASRAKIIEEAVVNQKEHLTAFQKIKTLNGGSDKEIEWLCDKALKK